MSKTDSEYLEFIARETALYRGHDLTEFSYKLSPDRTKGYAKCKHCGKGVWTDTKPPPNGIDIAGEAVALNCV